MFLIDAPPQTKTPIVFKQICIANLLIVIEMAETKCIMQNNTFTHFWSVSTLLY